MSDNGKYLGELLTMLKPENFDDSLGHGSKALPAGATVWPVQGKSLKTLWTKKGVILKRPVVIEFATKVPEWCAKKMSYFYDNPRYAMIWFKEPIALGNTQMTYGMVYETRNARNIGDGIIEGYETGMWRH